MTWTTYCPKHEALEIVEDVTDVKAFMVEQSHWPLQPEKTGRTATEVRGVTDSGCKVHFIGGAKWNR